MCHLECVDTLENPTLHSYFVYLFTFPATCKLGCTCTAAFYCLFLRAVVENMQNQNTESSADDEHVVTHELREGWFCCVVM